MFRLDPDSTLLKNQILNPPGKKGKRVIVVVSRPFVKISPMHSLQLELEERGLIKF